MCQTVFLVSVIAGAIDFFFRQDRRNSTGAIACSTQGEDSFHNGSGFLVDDQLFCFWVFGISIGSARPESFSAFRFGLLNCADLSAGVPNKPLVEQIFERHEVIALCVFRVHIVVDRNVPDAEHGEALFNVETGMLAELDTEEDDLQFAMTAYGLCVLLETHGEIEKADALREKLLARDGFWFCFSYLAAYSDYNYAVKPATVK